MSSWLFAKRTMGANRGTYELGVSSSFDIARATRRVVYYVLAVVLAYTANTLHGVETGRTHDALLAMVGIVVALVACMSARRPPSRTFLVRWVLFAACVIGFYAVVVLANGAFPWFNVPRFILLLALLPGLVHLLKEAGELGDFLRAFTNVMLVLAVLSTAMWLLGSMLHIVAPNCSFGSTWTGNLVISDGYFGLQYDVQSQEFPIIGKFYRNTGIYTEGPMYSFALCCALLFEVLFQRKPRKLVAAMLALTVLTTTSVTGIVLVAMLGAYLAARSARSQMGKAAVCIVVLAGLAVAVFLVSYKLGTSSGSTRLDDFRAGALAWSRSPLFGLGFSEYYDVVKSNMSVFRANNLGFSNAPTDVLAQGGLVYIAPMLAAFTGFFVRGANRADMAVAGILSLYLWTVTVVTYLPLTALLMAIGMERLCDREPESAPARRVHRNCAAHSPIGGREGLGVL